MAGVKTDPGAATMRQMEGESRAEKNGAGTDGGVLHLIVMGPNAFSMHPLPDEGQITIGRDEEDDVRVDEANASRHHARLHIGKTLEVEDLGSTNGTLLRGIRLTPGQRATVLPGEAIAIGWATLMVQRRRPAVRVRRLPTHAYFEGRLEEECERADRVASVFAMLRLHVAPGTPSDMVTEVMAGLLRPDDVLAGYGPDEYEVLLFESQPDRAAAIARDIVATLNQHGADARSGLAFYPTEARSADALIAETNARLAGREATGAHSSDASAYGPAMRRLYALAQRAALGNINVLILGETGVGKEVMAETIHDMSARAGKPLLRLNCAAFSSTLLESELFGHEKAAFTGAHLAKPGLLETAQGGTILLDEIGELPLQIQAKLLRVIETRQVTRLGAVKPRTIDVRFLAATNRVLEEEVDKKAFRQDLYYRLNGISLVIPPLRERMQEIEPLARSFLAHTANVQGRPVPQLSASALELLRAYAWPGNIRELRNMMERGFLLCGDERVITPEHLPVEKMRTTTLSAATTVKEITAPSPAAALLPLDEEDSHQRAQIVDALTRCQGNQTRAARLLGMPRRTFCARLKAYGIPRPRA